MAARPRGQGGKVFRLAYWNADGVRGRKLELEQFFCDYGVDVCLLNETYLTPGRALSFEDYVCRGKDRPTQRGSTTILVRMGINHYPVTVLSLQQLEATAIHLVLATRKVILALRRGFTCTHAGI
jgi:hypothetical protein